MASFSYQSFDDEAFSEDSFSLSTGGITVPSFARAAFSVAAFSEQAFSFDSAPPPVVVTTDTHDGDRKRHKKFKDYHETLREQLRVALEGPNAKELTHELESIATPQLADSRLVALADRLDYSGLREEIIAEILERHRARQDKEEEEIVILMALS